MLNPRIEPQRKDILQDDSVVDYDVLLESNIIDTSIEIDKPPTILSINDPYGTSTRSKRMFTLGNFSVIIGKAKSRKTFLLSLLVSVLTKKKDICCKFINEMESGKNLILWFDTEQGLYDSWNVVKRIQRMSGNLSNLQAYNLRPYSPVERREIIEYAIKKYGKQAGLVIIDGIADLVVSINDETEASEVSTLIMRLTLEYNFHCSTVIHQNKDNNFATGHIGSAVTKKAEIIISTNKIAATNETEVKCENSRGEGFEPFVFGVDGDGLPYLMDVKSVRKSETRFCDDVKPLVERDDELGTNFKPF